MSELKRCPFCGGEAVLNIQHNRLCTWWIVSCPKCNISQTGSEYWNESEAIEAWNTRKPMQNIVERLREKNMSLVDSANIACNEFAGGTVNGFELAIEIVKEEGGIDGSNL